MQLNLVSVRFAVGIIIITSILVITFSDSKSANALYIETRRGPWPEQMIASENNVYILLQDRLGNLFFKRSIDNGATFERMLKIGTNSVTMYQPTMAVSSNHVYVAWDHYADSSAIFFRTSIDNGASFGDIIILNNNTGGSKLGQLIASDNYVYVTWTNYSSNGQIFFARSTDNGKTFEDPVILSNADRSSVGPNMVISGSDVYVVWFQDVLCAGIEPPDPNCQSKIVFRKSSDNGKTFGDAMTIPINGTMFIGGYPQQSPAIAAAGNNVYISWLDISQTKKIKSDILLVKSEDNTVGNVISLAKGEIPTFDKQPHMIASGENVYVFWQAFDEEGKVGVVFVKSVDSGSTFEKVRIPDAVGPFNLFRQIALSDDNIYFVWSYGNKATLDVIEDDGSTFSNSLVFDPSDIPTASIAVSGSNVYLLAFNSNMPASEFEEPEEKIIFKRSIDSGKTFDRTMVLTPDGSFLMPKLDINSIRLGQQEILTSSLEPNAGPMIVGNSIVIQSQLTNTLSENTQFTYLVQVKDEQGFTVELLSMEGQIRSNESINPGLGWKPEKTGLYEIKTYVWSELSTPIPLAQFRRTVITVEGMLPRLPVN